MTKLKTEIQLEKLTDRLKQCLKTKGFSNLTMISDKEILIHNSVGDYFDTKLNITIEKQTIYLVIKSTHVKAFRNIHKDFFISKTILSYDHEDNMSKVEKVSQKLKHTIMAHLL